MTRHARDGTALAMLQHYETISRARELIKAALVAALNASPRDPGLSAAELQSTLEPMGVAKGTFHDAMQWDQSRPRDARNRILPSTSDLVELLFVSVPASDAVRPRDALNALGAAFDSVEKEIGMGRPVARDLLHARCNGIDSVDVDRAIAIMSAAGSIAQVDDRFRRQRPWPAYGTHLESADDALLAPYVKVAEEILSRVQDVFATRRACADGASDDTIRALP